MIMEAYTVFDKAVGAFLQPFYVRSKGEAIRSFTEAVNQKDHQFGKYPADYTLMFCGTFDDSSGIFTCDKAGPARVIGATECITDDPFTEANRDSPVPSMRNARGLPM